MKLWYPLAFSLAVMSLSCVPLSVQAQEEPVEANPFQARAIPPTEDYDFPDRRYYFTLPNPASLPYYNTGRLQLPSFRIDMGATQPTDLVLQDVQTLTTSFGQILEAVTSNQVDSIDSSALQAQLDSLLGRFESRVRVGYDIDANLLGFGGAPFAQLNIAGRPLSLGVHLGSNSRGYVSANFSDEFNGSLKTLSSSLPDVINTGSTIARISGDANNLIGQVNNLSSGVSSLVTDVNTLLSSPQNFNSAQLANLAQRLDQVDTDLDALLPVARELTESAETSLGTANTLLDAIESIDGGAMQLVSVNDGHLTLGVSGAYPVFQSPDITVSVGTRLKLFMQPYNVSVGSLVPGVASDLGLLGKVEINEFTGVQSVDNVRATLNTFSAANEEIKALVAQGETVSTGIDSVQSDLNSNNLGGAIATGTQLAQQSQSFIGDVNNISSSIQRATSEASNLQSTLVNEFQDVSFKGMVTTPSSAGFGMDLGVDALLYKHLRLGLSVQNPLVLWQGTQVPFEARVERGDSEGQAVRPALFFDESAAQNVNYSASVPLAVLANARYRFDELLPPEWSGLYGHTLLEFVANGRAPAWLLGAQKTFGDLGYTGLGFRVGGVSSLIYLEGGLNPINGFGLDAQLGISPTGTGIPVPGASWLGLARLGFYYRF